MLRRHLSYAGLVSAAILAASGALAEAPRLVGVRVGASGGNTRIVVDLTAPADLLVAPAGDGRGFTILSSASAAPNASVPRDPPSGIETVTLDRPKSDLTRVSLATSHPMAVKSVSLMPPEPGAPYRAVFDIGPAAAGDRLVLGIPWGSSPLLAKPDSPTLLRLAAHDEAARLSTLFAKLDHGDRIDWMNFAKVASTLGDAGAALVGVEHARLLAMVEGNRGHLAEIADLSAQILAESALVPQQFAAASPKPASTPTQVASAQIVPAPVPPKTVAPSQAAAPQPRVIATAAPPRPVPAPQPTPTIPAPSTQTPQPRPAATAPRVLLSSLGRQVASANPQIALGAERIGVTGAVNPATTGIEPDAAGGQILQIGNDILFKERIVTDTGGQTQILFLDHSALTVGSNADLTIDEFVYNPTTSTGKLAMTATVGVFRYVGGKLSKNEDGVVIKTPIATIGVRGGIAYISVEPSGRTQATLGFGAQLTVTGLNGATRTVAKPGFAITVDPPAQGAPASSAPPPSAPQKAAPALLTTMMQNVEATTSNAVNAPLQVTQTTVDQRLAPTGNGAPVILAPSTIVSTQVSPPPSAVPTVSVTQVTSTIERSVQAQTQTITEHAIVSPPPPPPPLVAPPPPPPPGVISPPPPPGVVSPPPSPGVVSPPPPPPPPFSPPPPPGLSPPPPHISTPSIPSLPNLPSPPSSPPVVSPPPPMQISTPSIPSLPNLPTPPSPPPSSTPHVTTPGIPNLPSLPTPPSGP